MGEQVSSEALYKNFNYRNFWYVVLFFLKNQTKMTLTLYEKIDHIIRLAEAQIALGIFSV